MVYSIASNNSIHCFPANVKKKAYKNRHILSIKEVISMALRDKPIACYSAKDVARRFGVTQRTVHAWIRGGHLLATRYPGTRDYRIAEEDIRSFEILGAIQGNKGRKRGRKAKEGTKECRKK